MTKKTNKSKTKKKNTDKKTAAKPLVSENSQITITLKAKNIKPSYQKHLSKLARELKVPGFRKGKVPLDIAEKKIGQNKLINQVLNELLPSAYQEAVSKAKKKPLSRPRFQTSKIVMDGDWQVIAYFAEKPEFKLGDYKKLVKSAKKTANKELTKIEKETKSKQKSKKADEKTKQGAKKLTAKQKKDMLIQHIFKELIQTIKPAVPQLLVEEQTQQDLKQLSHNLSHLNLKLEDYLKAKDMEMQQLTNQLAAGAIGKLQIDFILNEISQEAKLEVKEAELEDKIKELKNPDLEKKAKKDQYYRHYLKSVILRQKTIDYLYNI